MLDRISIENFKSIKSLDLKLNKINILIGSNGAGKSNFINFFKLLNSINQKKLQNYVGEESGANNILHHGLKNSEFLKGSITFSHNTSENIYGFTLASSTEGGLYFADESPVYRNHYHEREYFYEVDSTGSKESNLESKSDRTAIKFLIDRLNEFRIYHFHDTSKTALVKQSFNIHDNEYLYGDARNLASFLFKLKIQNPDLLKKIEKTIRLIAPYFDKFILKPSVYNEEEIRLGWSEKGSEMIFNASHFSDGTLRMVCLITLFMQPSLPKIIVIDEPELGLHPFALTVLSDLIKKVSEKDTQVIVSTQSIPLLENFSIDEVIIVEKEGKESTFKRPDMDFLEDWIDEYTLSELWDMNLLGGRP